MRHYVAGVRDGQRWKLYFYRRRAPNREGGFFYVRELTPLGWRTRKLSYLPARSPRHKDRNMRALAFVVQKVRRWEARERARHRWWTFRIHAYRRPEVEINLSTEILRFPVDIPAELKAGNDWWDEDLGLLAEHSEELAAFLKAPEEYLLGWWAGQEAQRRAAAAAHRTLARKRARSGAVAAGQRGPAPAGPAGPAPIRQAPLVSWTAGDDDIPF